MIMAKKIRLYPTEIQEKLLFQSAGTARFIYNWTLGRQEENYALGGQFISDNDLRKEITQMKKREEFAWLHEVSNNVAKQAVKDACSAYRRFFQKLADKPRFKSRKRSKVSFYNDNMKLKFKDKSVLIEKVGWISIKPHDIPADSKYTNPRITHDGKYWYIAVGLHREETETLLTGESLGIDLGIKQLAVCSNGKVYNNINKTMKVRRKEKKLRRLQRSVSRKYEMNKEGGKVVKTRNIIKLEKKIRLLHRSLRNIRSNHLHQTTSEIVKTKPSTVVMETLNIRGMMRNRHLAKAVAKQGFYELKRQLKYKCALYGIAFVEAGLWYPSSKICSSCGHKKEKLSLSERMYECEVCDVKIDRDFNASINLSRYEKSSLTS
ncbi:MAG TPA: transposase [Clostridiaceae bacterium]|nr:transposase [Clostridiaceae bacterium]